MDVIPISAPHLQYLSLREEIDAAIAEVLTGGNYIMGPNVRAFEQEVAAYLGCKYAIATNSGTDSLYLALRALGVGPGDEVITTPFTFAATTEAIGLVGARPVFVDTDLITLNIDANQIEDAVTSRTKAIIPVHLYGCPCEMDAISDISDRYHIPVVEDCAQSFGAKYKGKHTGTVGDVGCLSFFPSKNLGCMGDGGMLVTDNPDIAERAEMLRRHGGKEKYFHTELGINSRLDEIQAAILRVKLNHIDQWNHKRKLIAANYREHLEHHQNFSLLYASESYQNAIAEQALEIAYNQFTILVEDRETLKNHLQFRGISTAVYYPHPLHVQPVHAQYRIKASALPKSVFASQHALSLPMYPDLSEYQQNVVISALSDYCSRAAA